MADDVTHAEIVRELKDDNKRLSDKIDANFNERINKGEARMNAMELADARFEGRFDRVDDNLTRLVQMQEDDKAERKARQEARDRDERAFKLSQRIIKWAVAFILTALTAAGVIVAKG